MDLPGRGCLRRAAAGPIAAALLGFAAPVLAGPGSGAGGGSGAGPGDGAPPPTARVVGWAERVRLMDAGIVQKALIDTGAGLSALDATILGVVGEVGSAAGQRVAFAIDDGAGGTRTLEKAIVDWVDIKNKGAPGSTRRPVVTMTICLAGMAIPERVSLATREGFAHPLLIGRNLLARGGFLVDSRRAFASEPRCGGHPEPGPEPAPWPAGAPTGRGPPPAAPR